MKRVVLFAVVLSAIGGLVGVIAPHALAATPQSAFSLQVTPSPLVTTVKPGTNTTLELKIRNAGTAAEVLRIQARSFTMDDKTGDITLNEKDPPEIAPWLRFEEPTFTIQPGEWFTQKIHLDLPETAGFSYAFALQLSRKDAPQQATGAGRQIQGSVAVFGLVNVDRPGATRKLELASFEPEHSIVEHLPAQLNIRLRNTGNTIAQPYGNVFIQRGSKDTQPLATLPVNATRAYILPGHERTLRANWTEGWPVTRTTNDASGQAKASLDWGGEIGDFRFGRYTAKVVAVYNDGTRDIPVTGEVTFWVVPWKAILALVAVIALIVYLIRRTMRTHTQKAVKKALNSRNKQR